MTTEEKLHALQLALHPDTVEDELGEALLQTAGDMVLNRLYPFGYPVGTAVPARYEHLQLRIGAELFARRGAEGQTTHIVGDVQRVYEGGGVSASLLQQIVPMCGGVITS